MITLNEQIVRAGLPDKSHSELLLYHVSQSLLKDFEGVCRYYVENADRFQIDATQSLQLLKTAFLLRKLSPVMQRRVLTHPTMHYWIKAMRKCSSGQHAEYWQRFVETVADYFWYLDEARSDSEWHVRTDLEGGLRLPLRQRHLEFGSDQADQNVKIVPTTAGYHIRFEATGLVVEIPYEDINDKIVPDPKPSLEREGYEVRLYHNMFEGQLHLTNRDPYLRVHWTGTNQRTDGTLFFEPSPDQYHGDYSVAAYQGSVDLIEKNWKDGLKDICRFTPLIVPRQTPNKKIAFTVSSRQGAMFIDEMASDQMVENIVHENAHVKLRCIQMFDTILEDFSDESERFNVAWRTDPRPLPGIFEGLYVFSHVAEYAARDSKNYSTEKQNRLLNDIDCAKEILSKHGKFTPLGRHFFNELISWIDDLRLAA